MTNRQTSAPSSNVDARHRTLFVIWFGILSSICLMFFMSWFIEARPEGSITNPLPWIMTVLAGITVGLAFRIKRKFLAQSVESQSVALVQQAYIVAWALCEATSLFGLISYLAAGTRYYYIWFIFALAGMFKHLPRRDDLLAASFKAGNRGFTT